MITGARSPLTVDLTGLRVAISAGAGGIGKVMADSFAACGAAVFVSDIDTAALAGCGHAGLRADAGVVADMEGFVDAAIAHHGGLDVLVNNARSAGMARRAQWNIAARSIRNVASSSSGFTSSTRAVGPAMPALFTSTSSPP